MYNQLVCNEAFASVMHKPFTPQYRASSVQEIEFAIQRAYPQGVDAVVYGKSAVQGWSPVPNNKGIIAVLIGLVQSPRDVASGQATGKRQHKPVFLKPTGALGYAIEIGGQMAGCYTKIEWFY